MNRRRAAKWCVSAMGLLAWATAAPTWAADLDGDGVPDAWDACPETPTGIPVDAQGRPLGDVDKDCDVDMADFVLLQASMTGPSPNPAGMVLVPGGEFLMGDSFLEGAPDEYPRHAVQVDSFYMDAHEVTNQQYVDALNWALRQGNLIAVTNGLIYQDGSSIVYAATQTAETASSVVWNGSSFACLPYRATHPMVMVSWYGAAAYANWRSTMLQQPPAYDLATWSCNLAAGYRLPTEAEWEKAARGGLVGYRFPWADSDTIEHTRANYRSDAAYAYDTSTTRGYHPLWGVTGSNCWTSPLRFFSGALQEQAEWAWPGSPGSYQTQNGVNGYGLHDMAGGVWEFCNDWYDAAWYAASPYANPQGPTTGTVRVMRGTGWGWYASAARCAARASIAPDTRYVDAGIRLVLRAP